MEHIPGTSVPEMEQYAIDASSGAAVRQKVLFASHIKLCCLTQPGSRKFSFGVTGTKFISGATSHSVTRLQRTVERPVEEVPVKQRVNAISMDSVPFRHEIHYR